MWTTLDIYDIVEILSKVALSTITPNPRYLCFYHCHWGKC